MAWPLQGVQYKLNTAIHRAKAKNVPSLSNGSSLQGQPEGKRPPLCDNVEPCNKKAKNCMFISRQKCHYRNYGSGPAAQEPFPRVYTLQGGGGGRNGVQLCSLSENSHLTSAKHRGWHLDSCRGWGHQAISTHTSQHSYLRWGSLQILDFENWSSGVTPRYFISGELSYSSRVPQSGIWSAYRVKVCCLLRKAT